MQAKQQYNNRDGYFKKAIGFRTNFGLNFKISRKKTAWEERIQKNRKEDAIEDAENFSFKTYEKNKLLWMDFNEKKGQELAKKFRNQILLLQLI